MGILNPKPRLSHQLVDLEAAGPHSELQLAALGRAPLSQLHIY